MQKILDKKTQRQVDWVACEMSRSRGMELGRRRAAAIRTILEKGKKFQAQNDGETTFLPVNDCLVVRDVLRTS